MARKKKELEVTPVEEVLSVEAVVKADVHREVAHVISEYNQKSERNIKEHFGKGVDELLSVIERESTDPGFAGLTHVPDDVAQAIATGWRRLLETLQHRGEWDGDLPQGFICRMLDDGSLFLKSVSIPKGIVLCEYPETAKTTPVATYKEAPAQLPQEPSQRHPSVPASTNRKIGIDSSGKVSVKKS